MWMIKLFFHEYINGFTPWFNIERLTTTDLILLVTAIAVIIYTRSSFKIAKSNSAMAVATRQLSKATRDTLIESRAQWIESLQPIINWDSSTNNYTDDEARFRFTNTGGAFYGLVVTAKVPMHKELGDPPDVLKGHQCNINFKNDPMPEEFKFILSYKLSNGKPKELTFKVGKNDRKPLLDRT